MEQITRFMSKDYVPARMVHVMIVMITCAFFVLTACQEEQHIRQQMTEVDSLINEAHKAHDYDRIIALSDLYQETGTLSNMKAYYWRGYAYSRQRKVRLAELEWKQAIALDIRTPDDLEYYSMSANRLAGLLYMKFDYEGVMRVAVPAIKLLKDKDYTQNTDYANLQTFIGSCQLKMGNQHEAAYGYNNAYQCYKEVTEPGANSTIADNTTAIIGVITITDAYAKSSHFQETYEWTERFDTMLTRYSQHPQASDAFIDKQKARLFFFRACALEGLGKKVEAQKAYQEALNTRYGQSTEGRLDGTSYLMAANRWNEAAANYELLKSQMDRFDMKMTLDNIRTYLIPKFRANIGAHRLDSVVVTGQVICNALDSAIVWERQNAALELATIYDTQLKEMEIAQQKADLSHQRFQSTVIILVLVIFGFVLFIYFRHQAAKRLEKAYHHLEIANARAEEGSRMKSDFIHQISHEIRTPLNILSGFTQVITSSDMNIDEATRADINRQIVENTNRITGLVNKMLELSHAHSKKVIEKTDHVSAAQIAAEAVNESGIEAVGHLTFNMEIAPEAETLLLTTNLRAAARAISLLLDNARKFTAPAGASHHKGLEPTSPTAHVVLRVSVGAHQVVFAVEDTGIGIPPQEAEHIFEDFVQLDEYYDGTGIGLTVARSLARRLGGDVRLDTAYNVGARFVFTLPREVEESQS